MECEGCSAFSQELQQIKTLPSVAERNDRGGIPAAYRDHTCPLPPTEWSRVTEYDLGSQDTIFSKEPSENSECDLFCVPHPFSP